MPEQTIEPARLLAFDALRGIAAVIVLGHHLKIPALAHGYLAVDLFFLLSGYVIGHAYERPLAGKLGFWAFMRQRLIRLYPLIFLGFMLGYVVAVSPIHPVERPTLALIGHALFLPGLAGGPFLFLLNGLQWSLFCELIVNAAHALWLRRLSDTWLATLVSLCAIWLLASAIRFGGLSVGWGADNAVGGLARAAFSYAAGLLLFRLQSKGRLSITLPWPVILVAPILLITLASERWLGSPWLADVLTVMVGFPVVLALAARARLPRRVEGLAVLAGFISYPLYALQTPLQYTAGFLFYGFGVGKNPVAWLVFALTTLLLAWLAGRYYDAPVRAWLQQGAKRRLAAAPETPG